jgi:hypothetical protein
VGGEQSKVFNHPMLVGWNQFGHSQFPIHTTGALEKSGHSRIKKMDNKIKKKEKSGHSRILKNNKIKIQIFLNQILFNVIVWSVFFRPDIFLPKCRTIFF